MEMSPREKRSPYIFSYRVRVRFRLGILPRKKDCVIFSFFSFLFFCFRGGEGVTSGKKLRVFCSGNGKGGGG